MSKNEAISIAIKCTEETKRLFSQPKDSPLGTPRREEDQVTLDEGIKEIDEALLVLRSMI